MCRYHVLLLVGRYGYLKLTLICNQRSVALAAYELFQQYSINQKVVTTENKLPEYFFFF